MIRRPPRSTQSRSSAASDVYKRQIVAALAAEGRTVITISHDMRFVAETVRRMVVMRAGRIVLDGTPADVFAAASWNVLASTYLEPPLAALVGARLGVGSTPTEASLVEALGRADVDAG